jgi:hypothetical protein
LIIIWKTLFNKRVQEWNKELSMAAPIVLKKHLSLKDCFYSKQKLKKGMFIIKVIWNIVILLYLFTGLVGCSNQTIEGYVIEVYDESVLLAQNISHKKYNEIKDMSANEVFEKNELSLISLTYQDAQDFREGDKVKVWIDGGVNESYPAQAKAKKIEKK